MGATLMPSVGPTSTRNTEMPRAKTAAAIQSNLVMMRWLINAPKKSDASSEVAMIGSTTTSVPSPMARASKT